MTAIDWALLGPITQQPAVQTEFGRTIAAGPGAGKYSICKREFNQPSKFIIHIKRSDVHLRIKFYFNILLLLLNCPKAGKRDFLASRNIFFKNERHRRRRCDHDFLPFLCFQLPF